MKWIFLVSISLIVSSLCAKEIVDTDAIVDGSLPQTALKDIKESSVEITDSYETTTTTSDEDTVVEKSGSAAVVSSNSGALPSDLMALDEESSDSELKRVKKANTLTTLCVEIKPSSPYEPPYYMCRGTDEQPNSKGNYEPANYWPMKPTAQGYSQYEDSSNSGGYGRPKPSKYDKPFPTSPGSYKPMAPSYGGYVKPSGQNSYEESGNSNYGNQKPMKYPAPYDMTPPMQPKPMKYQEIVNPYFNNPMRPPYGSSAYSPPSSSYGPPANYQSSSYSPSKPTTPMYGPAGYNSRPSEMYQPNSGYNSGKYGSKKLYTSQKNPPKYGYRAEENELDNSELSEQDDLAGPQLQSVYQYGPSAGAGYQQAAPKPFSYKAPAPQVPCGSNLLFSCNPNVVPVPCYSSPSYKIPPPPIVYNFPPPQSPPLMYGPPMQPQPLPYYPNLGAAHQGIPQTPGRNIQKINPESKKDFDSNQDKEPKFSEDDEKKFNNSSENNTQDAPMKNTSNDSKNKQSPDYKLKSTSFSRFDSGQFARGDSFSKINKSDKKKDDSSIEMEMENIQRKDATEEDDEDVKNSEPALENFTSSSIMKNRQQMQHLQRQQMMDDSMNIRNMQAHPGAGVSGQLVYRNDNW